MDITTAEYIQLNCNERHLGDANISRILDVFVFDIKILNPIKILNLANNDLTRIPKQIRHFTRLKQLNLNFNHIQSLPPRALNLTTSFEVLGLKSNGMRTIEPGAFDGITFGIGSRIDLDNNNLTRIDREVFLPVLQAMAPYLHDQSTGISLENSKNFTLLKKLNH